MSVSGRSFNDLIRLYQCRACGQEYWNDRRHWCEKETTHDELIKATLEKSESHALGNVDNLKLNYAHESDDYKRGYLQACIDITRRFRVEILKQNKAKQEELNDSENL